MREVLSQVFSSSSWQYRITPGVAPLLVVSVVLSASRVWVVLNWHEEFRDREQD